MLTNRSQRHLFTYMSGAIISEIINNGFETVTDMKHLPGFRICRKRTNILNVLNICLLCYWRWRKSSLILLIQHSSCNVSWSFQFISPPTTRSTERKHFRAATVSRKTRSHVPTCSKNNTPLDPLCQQRTDKFIQHYYTVSLPNKSVAISLPWVSDSTSLRSGLCLVRNVKFHYSMKMVNIHGFMCSRLE